MSHWVVQLMTCCLIVCFCLHLTECTFRLSFPVERINRKGLFIYMIVCLFILFVSVIQYFWKKKFFYGVDERGKWNVFFLVGNRRFATLLKIVAVKLLILLFSNIASERKYKYQLWICYRQKETNLFC